MSILAQGRPPQGQAPLDVVIQPSSVAIVGASDDPSRIGGRPLAHALAQGYAGPVYPVNPTRETVQGLRAYKSLEDLPRAVDCAVIALPAHQVLDSLQRCAALGVRGAVIFSAGFAEMGEAGIQNQLRLSELARAHGMRVLGPNCVGSYSARHRAFQTFLGAVPTSTLAGLPRVGLASQSGGYGSHLVQLARRRGLAVEKLVTTGNEADVELGEVIGWMAESDDVDIIVAYVEGVRDRETFIDGLRKAHARRKPVILQKVGATENGAAAAASHTAVMAGADAIYEAVIQDCGALRAKSTEHVLDILEALSTQRPLKARKLCVASISGGAGVQLADFTSHYGLTLPPPTAQVQASLLKIIPAGSPRNPVDLTAQVINQPAIFEQSLGVLLDAGYDSVITWLGPAVSDARAGEPMRRAVERAAASRPDVQLTFAMIGDEEVVASYRKLGCLVFEEPKRAVRALAALQQLHGAFERTLPSPPDCNDMPLLPREQKFNEAQAKEVLRQLGIGSPQERVVRTPEEAAQASQEMGGAVAIKVVSPDIAHKTEVGGVALNIQSGQAAADAVQRMAQTLAALAPQAHIDGYLVSPMLKSGVECIVGIHLDPLFGPVVMFGVGGVLVEVLQDVAFSLAPVDEAGARAMIGRVKAHRILEGVRGRPASDVGALARSIAAVSRLAVRNADRLVAFEINPLVVLADGQGVVALDAVLTTGEAARS